MTRLMLTMGLLVVWMWPLAGQSPLVLDIVRQRYASADYDGALAVLAATAPAPRDAVEADRLRAFSLLALGQVSDADAVIARIVTAEPRWLPGDDHSPRVRAAFRTVRDRVLPAAARRLYDEGRAAFERRAFGDAALRLGEALPIMEALALDGRAEMEDLRILTNGFLTLSREMAPKAEPEPARLTAGVKGPVQAAELVAAVESAVTEAVPLRQDLPPWRLGLGGPDSVFRGAIAVSIDEDGRVVDAQIAVPVHPGYDSELLRAAMNWRYEPARRGGQTVRTRRRVEVELRSR
jgi:TonB family protein